MDAGMRAAGLRVTEEERDDRNGSAVPMSIGESSKKRGFDDEPPASRKRRGLGKNGPLHEDERVTKSGWIKKKIIPLAHRGPADWETKPAKALGAFRANLGAIK